MSRDLAALPLNAITVSIEFPRHWSLRDCLKFLSECGYPLSFPAFTKKGRLFEVGRQPPGWCAETHVLGELVVTSAHRR